MLRSSFLLYLFQCQEFMQSFRSQTFLRQHLYPVWEYIFDSLKVLSIAVIVLNVGRSLILQDGLLIRFHFNSLDRHFWHVLLVFNILFQMACHEVNHIAILMHIYQLKNCPSFLLVSLFQLPHFAFVKTFISHFKTYLIHFFNKK